MLWVKLLDDYNKLIRKEVEGSRLHVLMQALLSWILPVSTEENQDQESLLCSRFKPCISRLSESVV
jgi:hypothetical protein